ncbi:hypothetical protein MRX96_059910 [Rhipicephalus microplus]
MEQRGLINTSHSDSEYTTSTTITHSDGAYSYSTNAATTYTTDDTRSAGFVPAAANAGPKQYVSLGQLTYIVTSSKPSASPEKASTGSRRDETMAERRAAGKFEGQRREAQPLAPAKLPPLAPTPEKPTWEKRLTNDDRQPKTTPQVVPGVARTALAANFRSSHERGALNRRPALIPPRESKPAAPPKSTTGELQCALRDVATSTDALLRSSNDNLRKNWIGTWLVIAIALLATMLVASAVTTVVVKRNPVDHSDLAGVGMDKNHRGSGAAAGLVPKQLLGSELPEIPTGDDSGTAEDEDTTRSDWQSSSALTETAHRTSEQPAAGDTKPDGSTTTRKNAAAAILPTRSSMQPPFRSATRKPECGAVFYKYCLEPKHEFFYQASLNACVDSAAGDRPTQLCNRGPNRFASRRECEASCVQMKQPHEPCLDSTLFTECRRRDFRSSWWWFDGSACLPWSFPNGECPANGSTVFATAEKCNSRCTNSPCAPPRSTPCASAELKFPFFAAEAPSSGSRGVRRCLRLTRRLFEARRCLAGANRFSTRATCELVCKVAPSTTTGP